MLCRKCMIIMDSGTRYEKRKGQDKPSHKRYFECGKCHSRIYTNTHNFQEVLVKESKKNRNK